MVIKTITAKELEQRADPSVLILDVREKDAFDDWHIPGAINIDVSKDMKEGKFTDAMEKLKDLPIEKKIITVCNKGMTAHNASLVLDSMGYQTEVLEHGMTGWNTLCISGEIIHEQDLVIVQIARMGKGCLSYIVISPSTTEALVIDPSIFTDEYLDRVNEYGAMIGKVLETHVHADHLSGAQELCERTNAEYFASSDDIKTIKNDVKKMSSIEMGNNKIEILRTPGHTEGSVCYLLNTYLFTGDTLFLDGVGRPDLGKTKEEMDTSAHALFHSLEKIKQLDEKVIVLPAHVPMVQKIPQTKSLGEVIKDNKSLHTSSEEEFVHHILSTLPIPPPHYHQIKQMNLALVRADRETAQKLEFGPNRCATG